MAKSQDILPKRKRCWVIDRDYKVLGPYWMRTDIGNWVIGSFIETAKGEEVGTFPAGLCFHVESHAKAVARLLSSEKKRTLKDKAVSIPGLPKYVWANGAGSEPELWFSSPRKFVLVERDGDDLYVPIGDKKSSLLKGGFCIEAVKKDMDRVTTYCDAVQFMSEDKEAVSQFTQIGKKVLKELLDKYPNGMGDSKKKDGMSDRYFCDGKHFVQEPFSCGRFVRRFIKEVSAELENKNEI